VISVKLGTVATYDRHLRTFFAWLVKEEVLDKSPMDKISEPIARLDRVALLLDLALPLSGLVMRIRRRG